MILYPDFKPLAASNAKTDHVKSFPIFRSDTVATLTYGQIIPIGTIPNTEWNYARAVLPAAATPLCMTFWSQAGSNAGTTATINLGAVMPYVSISAAGTTATVTFALPHRLTTADFIFVQGTGVANFNTAAATAVASVPSATTITYTIASTTATTTQGELVCLSYYFYNFSVLGSAGNGHTVPNAISRFGFAPNATGAYQSGMFHVGFPNINPITSDTDWGYPIQGGDQILVPTYAETGTASSTGGPWVVNIWYTV
jgi:hypothetical protein